MIIRATLIFLGVALFCAIAFYAGGGSFNRG